MRIDQQRGSLRNHSASGGFTLLELIVVVAIIAALAAIAIPAYVKYVDKARITVAVNTMDTVRKQLESYQVDHNQYPITIDFATGLDGDGVTVFIPDFILQISEDFSSIVSYTPIGETYTLVARANDTEQTLLTLTPEGLAY